MAWLSGSWRIRRFGAILNYSRINFIIASSGIDFHSLSCSDPEKCSEMKTIGEDLEF
mgnify:CR=1 FL=1